MICVILFFFILKMDFIRRSAKFFFHHRVFNASGAIVNRSEAKTHAGAHPLVPIDHLEV